VYRASGRYVIQIALLLLLTGVIVALVISLIHLGKNDFTALSDRMAGKSRESLKVLKPCPICGTLLERGERVHTIVFSGESPGHRKRDQERPRDAVVHMFGCPYCYPPNGTYQRICPVCTKPIPDDGFVVARMFEKGSRKHVHVLGCTSCRSGAAAQGYRRSG
jgi:hypothetical protein